jgi:hypothetical protein
MLSFFAILRTPTAMPSIMGPRHGKMLENKVGKLFAFDILSQIFVRIAKINSSLQFYCAICLEGLFNFR